MMLSWREYVYEPARDSVDSSVFVCAWVWILEIFHVGVGANGESRPPAADPWGGRRPKIVLNILIDAIKEVVGGGEEAWT